MRTRETTDLGPAPALRAHRPARRSARAPGGRMLSAASSALRWLAATMAAAALVACGGGGSDAGVANASVASLDGGTGIAAATDPGAAAEVPGSAAPTMSPLAAVGELAFKDASLSASGRMSCATCHDPARGHAGEGPWGVPAGGRDLDVFGFRKSPGIRYLRFAPSFSLNPNPGPGNGPPASGGLFWDGRADTLAEQAGGPFTNPREMALTSHQDVVDRLSVAPYATQFLQAAGLAGFLDAEAAFAGLQAAIAAYQGEDAGFAAFTSKFDAVSRGAAGFSAAEARGFGLFRDPQKGNCAACHSLAVPPGAAGPLFTDFSYHALGVPRNAAIPDNADPAFFDLGLCGPARTELAARTRLCGIFKVPSLRNVALTTPYFHNGRFATLAEVVRFYARRDSNPGEFYPRDAQGGVLAFDDLPAALRANVTQAPPFGVAAGQPPRLTEAEVQDIVAFLGALSDGFVPTP